MSFSTLKPSKASLFQVTAEISDSGIRYTRFYYFGQILHSHHHKYKRNVHSYDTIKLITLGKSIKKRFIGKVSTQGAYQC